MAVTAAEERNLENVREVAILAERTMEVGEDSETEVKLKLSVSLLAVFVSRVRYSQVYEDDNKSISVLSSYHIYFILS